MTGRRVAIAYTSFAVGRGLLQYARDKVLSPNDEIYIVHSFPDKNPVVHQTMKLVRAMTLQRGDTMGEVTRDNSIDFGADLLAAFPKVHLNVVLQVWSGQGGRCRARRRWRREGCSVLFLGGGGGGVGSGRVAGA
jgi:hypothetical protein